MTLLSSGRGSGASSAPSSTRQVEGRRASRAAPAPLPLPADISEPPLSATQLGQRPQHRAAQPSCLAHCAARAGATLTAAQCGREAPLYLERVNSSNAAHAHRLQVHLPAPSPRAPSRGRSENCNRSIDRREPSRGSVVAPRDEGSPARGGRAARRSAASAAGAPPAWCALSARACRPCRPCRVRATHSPCSEFKAPHLLPIVKRFCLETAAYVMSVKLIRLCLILT